MKIRTLIADDHNIFREGLRSLLQTNPSIEVLGEAENGRAAVRLAQKLDPDVVIMDVAMPDLNGIEATRQITAENSRIKVLALSMHTDGRYVMRMLHAGASGYLLKDCAFEELTVAIETVYQNKVYLSPMVAGAVVKEAVQRLDRDDSEETTLEPEEVVSAPASQLTAREREVLQLVAEGNATREIAALLHISVKTVESHRKQIMDKLNLHNVAKLTKYAIREGLTSLE
jgi:RNA polymerase sigma factor (sigma-70 family)